MLYSEEIPFYGMSQKGAETSEILEYAILTKAQVRGTLGDLVGLKEYRFRTYFRFI
jgi:hypothetical protein